MAVEIDFIFLLKAIRENIPVYINYKEGKKEWQYISRFLKLVAYGNDILIDLPFTEHDTYKPLEKSFRLTVGFTQAGFRFEFKTKVQENINYRIDENKVVPALVIKWPAGIKEANRRNFFRVEMLFDDSTEVKYVIPKIKSSNQQGKKVLKRYGGIEAIMIDISQNGMTVKMSKAINIVAGERIRIYFWLKNLNNRKYVIDGIIRNVREFNGIPVVLCGIEFTETGSGKVQENLKKIVSYVMAGNQENVSIYKVDKIFSKNSMVKKIVAGEITRGILEMVLSKEFSLTDQEYLESLVHLHKFRKYEKRISAGLKSIPAKVKEEYIKQQELNFSVAYFLLNQALAQSQFRIIAAVLNNQYLPLEFWLKIAKEGTAKMLMAMLVFKNRIIAYPEIKEVMKKNPHITHAIKIKIASIEKDYLNREKPVSISEHFIAEDIEVVLAKEKNINAGRGLKKEALNILQKINRLTVRQRIMLAFNGSKSERMVLAKDQNNNVLLAIIESPRIGEDEVLNILQKKNISREIFLKVLNHKTWLNNHLILIALLKHPKLPVMNISNLIRRIPFMDLKLLAGNLNINQAVRKIIKNFIGKIK